MHLMIMCLHVNIVLFSIANVHFKYIVSLSNASSEHMQLGSAFCLCIATQLNSTWAGII